MFNSMFHSSFLLLPLVAKNGIITNSWWFLLPQIVVHSEAE